MNKFFTGLTELNSTIRTILLVGVAVLIGLVYLNYNTKSSLSDYITKYNAFRAQGESTLVYVDSLKGVIGAYEKANEKILVLANKYQKKADSIAKVRPKPEVVKALQDRVDDLVKTTTDTMEMARVIIPAQAELIDTLNVTVKNQAEELEAKTGEIFSLHNIIRNDSSIIRFQNKSIDSLQKVVINFPKAPKDPDKILGFQLPSRKLVYVAGVLTGIAADLFIRK